MVYSLIKNLGLLVIISIIIVTDIFSLTVSNLQRTNSDSDIYFIENKGQIIDQNYQPNPTVLYLLNTPGFNVQLRKGGFSYDIYARVEQTANAQNYPDNKKLSVSKPDSLFKNYYHRIDFELIGSNLDCKIIATNASIDNKNYYTSGTSTEGILYVTSYKNVTYKNIYTGIDLEFSIDNAGNFKYNFIIHPGGKLTSIKMMIKDPEIILSSTGSLILITEFGKIEENILNSYLLCNNNKTGVEIKFQKLYDNIYGFSIIDGKIDFVSDLIIDPIPTRLWGTYFGGEDFLANPDESIYSISLDSNGDIIIAGQTSSANNIATIGAHQSTISMPPDAFLSKFTSDGVQIWGTYYGGVGIDKGDVCISDKNGNIYLYGVTQSINNISSPGAWQTNYGGGLHDYFLVKFNKNGVRQWGTYFGGNGDEALNTDHDIISIDTNCNVFITGATNSINMASPGAYQDTLGGGFYDAFLAKFDSNGQRVWSTYFGGTGDDRGKCTSIDSNGHLYLSGYTNSISNIATPGAHQTTFGGGPLGDAFLALFDSDGQLQWCTYYGGSNDDEGYACVATNTHMVYLIGATFSTNNISTPEAYQTNLANNSEDAFIVKFNENGTRQWGTYYGGESNEWAYSGSYDPRGFIFFGGLTFSYQDIATANSWQPVKQAGADAFIIKFDSLGQRIWGTYYGGPGTDYGWTLTVDTNDRQYLAGMTTSQTGIATANSHQPNHSPGGPWDGFFVKLTDCVNPIPGQIVGPTNVCINSTNVNYSIPPIQKVISYVWSVPSGVTLISGQNTNSINVNLGSALGTGEISVYATNHCGTGDTVYKNIIINSLPNPTIIGKDTACSGQMLTYYTQPGNSFYQWSISSGGLILSGGTTNDPSIFVVWNSIVEQWIRVNYTDTNGCSAGTPVQFNVWITASDTVDVSISASADSVCQGTTVIYTASTINGGSSPNLQWKVNGNNVGTNDSVFTYSPSNGDVINCVLISSNTVCTTNNPATSNAIAMIVNPNLPVSVSISAPANPFCIGNSVTFTAAPVNGGISPSYQWKVNGMNVGTNSSTYTYNPVSGDLVTCIMTSSALCVSGNPATSNAITMIGNIGLPAGVSIIANPNPFCPGSPVTLTATPVNGGSSPAYQWKVNGNNAGTNSPIFTYNPTNNDSVRCIMTSNLNCISGNPAISNKIILSGTLAPILTFTPCFDTITTVNAKPINLKGGIPLGGTYSGPGVNSTTGVFTPSLAGIGTKTITYLYTNGALCSASKTKNIIVQSTPAFLCGNNLTDIRDSKVYPTVQIGSQCWMAANLNYGTMILSSSHQRDNCIPEKYCYNDLTANCQLRTANYQWDELMQYTETPGLQGLCPPGWHVPTENDWNTLFANYINNAFAGSPLKYSGYSGFNALLLGTSFMNKGWDFNGFATYFWTSTTHGSLKAWAHAMNDYDPSVSLYPAYRSNAFSVRCLKDN